MNAVESRPQAGYRDNLLRALEALRPARVLEVGCGGGSFLRQAAGLDLDLLGIDPDEESIRSLRAEGYAAQVGRAEQLPFSDDSFDATVFCFTAHHLEDWREALLEALRVSRAGVLVLDPWYEHGIQSQIVAEEFDRWSKAADRVAGMVHNDCLSAGALLGPVMDRLSEFDVGVHYMLSLRELGVEKLESIAREQLRRCPRPEQLLPQLQTIVGKATQFGFSDDGAVLVALRKL
jgi:SAM-dependent methyltransferase